MPFTKVYIHFIWSTKKKMSPLAIKQVRQTVWNHIKENAKKKGIYIEFIKGYLDHCHCLISLKENQTLQKVMEEIKGETTFCINNQGDFAELAVTEILPVLDRETKNEFEWEDDYFTIAVLESVFDRVNNFNQNYEQHDDKKLFNDEYNEYIIKYGFQRFSWLLSGTRTRGFSGSPRFST